MAEHQGFTREEATSTPQGEIRAVILWEITLRCGQVPDLHPRLLEGIEVAARKVATDLHCRSGATGADHGN